MYPNLKAEMSRVGMTMLELSEKTGIRYQTLTLKLNGKSKLSVREAVRIKDALDGKFTLEYLFFDTGKEH